jgi:hypothetical protein
LHGSFPLFNSAHVGHPRALVQQRRQLVELGHGTDRIDLYPSVVFIPNPPAKADCHRVLFYEPAKSDALNPARHIPLTSLGLYPDTTSTQRPISLLL